MVPMGYSYSSDSPSSTVPMGYSHFPSSSQLPPPSTSRPIAIKKLFSLDDDGFQSSPSPKDWDVPSHSPYETYEFSHSPQTPDELPRSWRSSSFRSRLSSQDRRYGYQHAHQYDDDLDNLDLWEYDERRLRQREESFRRREEEISLREQELKRREEDVMREEEAKQKPRPDEKEAKRVEDEIMYKQPEIVRQEEGEGAEHEEDAIKWKEKLAQKKEENAGRQDEKRAEDLGRREEPAARRLEEDERHMTRDVLRKPEESKRQEDEAKFKEQASRTKEEKIRRKEEELARREEELSRREAEANRRYDQQKVQQEEFQKRVKEIRRQSVEEKTKQGWKSWGYHPRPTTTPPPRMSTSRSFSSSTGPWSIFGQDENMSTASPPANRGRSASINTSRSSTTWTSSTRLSSTASSWRSNISKPQTPSAQRNQPCQMSPPNSNELHMSAAGSSTIDRGRTCTSRSNATWTSSSRLSSNASLHLSSTPNPQTPSAYKNPPRQMSTSKSSSSSAGPWPIPSRNKLHISATNSHRDRSKSTSTSRSNTPWTFSRLSSITRSQSSRTPELQTPTSQKRSPPRSASFSITGRPDPKRNDLHIPTTSPPTHKSRSKSTSTGRSSSTWAYSTRPIPTVSSQPSITPRSQKPSAQQNKKAVLCAIEAGAMKEDSKGGGIKCKETQARNRTVVVRPEKEKEERYIVHDRSAKSGRTAEEARLEAFGAMHTTEEEVLKEEQPVRGKECDKPPSHDSGNTLPQTQSLLNTPTSETTAIEEDSLEDLTNELQRRSRYPIASGGFGDIWKCDLVKPSGTVQVAVKTIRSFESDNEELMRKNARVIFLFHPCQSFQPYLDVESAS
ncbi:uncharacterized protein BJ212DRAFT_1373920 [Suillus subaureus]|uniref:Protein kinase domain-containing protein n=1 Tax=Suillus subaureus TaxID=48587 RepID=A0A9P7E6A1_9AGAM|nr:uncharacterized protein BJ212DRAFT_1373920 [Suillus subaureus]KAG1811891.1 hypothetical protein BJ212DRAFT_1373920 [Suillus subaureus]